MSLLFTGKKRSLGVSLGVALEDTNRARQTPPAQRSTPTCMPNPSRKKTAPSVDDDDDDDDDGPAYRHATFGPAMSDLIPPIDEGASSSTAVARPKRMKAPRRK